METETLQIHLNSKDAIKYNNGTSDCEFNFNTIEILPQYYIHLSVKHAVIPYSFYNVNKTNNTLIIRSFSIPFSYSSLQTITLSIGNHNVNTLLSDLKSKIDSHFTITYNSITNKMTFTNSLYDFCLVSSSTCLEILGFGTTTTDIYDNGLSLTSLYVMNLQPVQCICINSNFISNSITSGNQNNGTIIASMPINNQPFTMITYSNQTNYKINLFSNVFNRISIKFQDQNGNLIDLNNLHWSMTLQFDILKFTED